VLEARRLAGAAARRQLPAPSRRGARHRRPARQRPIGGARDAVRRVPLPVGRAAARRPPRPLRPAQPSHGGRHRPRPRGPGRRRLVRRHERAGEPVPPAVWAGSGTAFGCATGRDGRRPAHDRRLPHQDSSDGQALSTLSGGNQQ
jgi:hypothetical protein